MRSFVIVLALAGCASAPRNPPPQAREAAPVAVSVPAGIVEAPVRPRHVLVTGFNDWRDLGAVPNVWRCRDNPSCRLLLGEPEQERPTAFDGPLPKALAAHDDGIAWSFATLPVTWEAFEALEIEGVEIVIHLGLGVYDRFDVLQPERGAYNLARGKDAAGVQRDQAIDPAAPLVRMPPADTRIADKLASASGLELDRFRVTVADAREKNAYLCNETHFRALTALERARARGGPLSEVYFVHIPYAENGDYAVLATAVAELVRKLAAA